MMEGEGGCSSVRRWEYVFGGEAVRQDTAEGKFNCQRSISGIACYDLAGLMNESQPDLSVYAHLTLLP